QRRHFGGWLGGVSLTMAGAGLAIFAGVVLVFLELAGFRHGEYAISWMLELGIVALFAVPGLTILLWRMVERSREQLALVSDAHPLRAMLSSMQAQSRSNGAVVVPAAVLEEVAVIENLQIARERTHAVLASVRTLDRGYGVLLAHDVTAQKAGLAGA